MASDVAMLLGMGFTVVVLGLSVLTLLVRRDLAPAQKLAGSRQVMIGGALGLGIFAFAFKLAVIFTLVMAPDWTTRALLRSQAGKYHISRMNEVASTPGLAVFSPWQALPETAVRPTDSPALTALGKRLFHETALSGDGTLACVSCHDLGRGAGADGRATATGIAGQVGGRNVPTVYNAAFQARLFWDGRAGSLEEQAMGPILNPIEMGMPDAAAAERALAANPDYAAAFRDAFGDERISFERVARAIAAYERTLVTRDAPYDRFMAGDVTALSAQQRRGMALFQSLGCILCHQGPNFSGAATVGFMKRPFATLDVRNVAIAQPFDLARDRGRAGKDAAVGVWRIPSLRNVALTGPWLHNGAVDDLATVVKIMATVQIRAVVGDAGADQLATVAWSPATRSFQRVVRKHVSEADVADLVAFLKALSSDRLRSASDEARRSETP